MNHNIFPNELIGLQAEVVESTNYQLIGIKGIIVNETKSMFIIYSDKGLKNIPKNNNKWKFYNNINEVTLDGNQLVERPEDREFVK